jgi:hypothetical protein
MDSRELGKELSQRARLLFDAAAHNWYLAAGLEVVAGVAAAVLGLLDLPSPLALAGALVGFLVLLAAYVLRLRAEDQYGTAETMRRQSVFSEALGWSASPVQVSVWRQKAGARINRVLRARPRDEDYYASERETGAARLAEMTLESAFYTRYQYRKLRGVLWLMFGGAVLLSLLVLTIPYTRAVPDNAGLLFARTVYSVLPIVLALNLLGWALRLGGLASAIQEVEEGLEELRKTDYADDAQVMRLVAEYNCQVVAGFPIHLRLFERWHPEIREAWNARWPGLPSS